jgi:hypothetical protein
LLIEAVQSNQKVSSALGDAQDGSPPFAICVVEIDHLDHALHGVNGYDCKTLAQE